MFQVNATNLAARVQVSTRGAKFKKAASLDAAFCVLVLWERIRLATFLLFLIVLSTKIHKYDPILRKQIELNSRMIL
ncbi:hypothetical protein A141_10415 [Vibrio crassostreae ZF-91]|nr:hypothetical protein A141_10415 [Vibrio crassostreae ZF-91]